ncbi:homocysteine S-methyltransferase family protein, partial [Erysipelotrichaceae bacterium OttesenSCG-928-M19]|nr:homocysteine S-methyltransferase family protein [Erysipelotrichaceae bacterium OttesenSCG-928-M19]
MKILEYLEANYLIFDGAMGSLLQQGGLKAGELPELLNVTKPELIQDIHYHYYKNGANVVLTNTFGANPLKYAGQDYPLEMVIAQAIENAKVARERIDKQAFIAYDIGPLGQLLEPSGTLTFDEAYQCFERIVVEAIKHDIDAFVVETISDLMEAKAAILAIKEHSELPIFVTLTFEKNQRTLVGNDIISIVATLEGLRVAALGLNCGFGPKEMLPLVQEFSKYTSLPLMVQPNAGMPTLEKSELKYDIDAFQFLEYMKAIIACNVQIVGGCCGTSYQHINLLSDYLKHVPFRKPSLKEETIVCSGAKAVVVASDKVIRVGERINPTGKENLKQALLAKDYNYIIKEALKQEEEGADILDVNVGIPKVDEGVLLKNNIQQIQSYVKIPLQIDSSSATAIKEALHYYNGKAIINSVNGKDESLATVLPLVAKYGGVIIGLCLDENGLATTAAAKLKIARKIVTQAKAYGISNKDILIDTLTLTASAQQADVKATLEAITLIKEELHVKTILGASNVSFGLPYREVLNASFLSMAIYAGLDACIINTG